MGYSFRVCALVGFHLARLAASTAFAQCEVARLTDDYLGPLGRVEPVALDGERLAIGTPRKNERAGAVYVFRRDFGEWVQEARLIGSDVEPGAYFGTAVSLDGLSTLIRREPAGHLTQSQHVI